MSLSTSPSNVVELPSDLINQDALDLQRVLLAALENGGPIALQAQNVSRVGTIALQLLLALQRSARARGISVAIEQPSSALQDAARCLGLSAELGFDAH